MYGTDLRTLGLATSTMVDSFFSTTANTQSQLDDLANKSLSAGIDLFTNNDYAGAVKQFKRSIALSPSSDYSAKAYEYLAQAFLKQGNTKEAENTYKQMIKQDPSNDSAHLSLGNLYFANGQYSEAEAEYTMAVRINPGSANNRYALGKVYMTTERFEMAENQFRRVVQIAPSDPNSYEALGQSLRSLGRYGEAEFQFQKTIALNKKFTDGYLDLGYLYTDMELTDKAQEQLDTLTRLDKDKASELKDYMDQAAAPKINLVYNTGDFPLTLGSGTDLSSIDDTLAVPGGSEAFTLNFMFDKEMDSDSVQNPGNWYISRATAENPGGAYNLGLPIPSTEVLPPSNPSFITYDPSSHIAQVTFWITQNSLADGTIDPSHLVFQFKGKDAYGHSMDPSADQYSNVSKIV
jgi:tetratricopeptide (TPR) repeat protein